MYNLNSSFLELQRANDLNEREREERDAEQGDASNYANTETEKNAFDVFTAASQTC